MPDVLADDPKSKAASGDERSPLPPVFTPNSVSPMAIRLERCMRRVSSASEGARTGTRGRVAPERGCCHEAIRDPVSPVLPRDPDPQQAVLAGREPQRALSPRSA
jgi:hypothetical protein